MNKFREDLANRFWENKTRISSWFNEKAQKGPLPFNCSIDLRDSGYKIAPVDCNLFPAGFNNICEQDLQAAPKIIQNWFEFREKRGDFPKPEKILIIPEKNTRNHFYTENLFYLIRILNDAGFETALGWPDDPNSVELESVSGQKLKAHPIELNNGYLKTSEMTPDLVLLNNDFSSGHPEFLDDIKQPVLPSKELGWHTRKKSQHFKIYNALAEEFAKMLSFDPWSIQVDTKEISPVHFNDGIGIKETAEEVDLLFDKIQSEYLKRDISDNPAIFVKSNQGTYGMGILQVKSGDELISMNRRSKNKMSVGKNKKNIGSVIVQEGIPTSTLYQNQAAEPVIYLIGCELIGGFLRTNPDRGKSDNLNSKGMVLKKFCMSDLQNFLQGTTNLSTLPGKEHLFELVYGSIAKLSALAAGMEIRQNS